MLKNSLGENTYQPLADVYRRAHLQCKLRRQCRPEHVPSYRLEVYKRSVGISQSMRGRHTHHTRCKSGTTAPETRPYRRATPSRGAHRDRGARPRPRRRTPQGPSRSLGAKRTSSSAQSGRGRLLDLHIGKMSWCSNRCVITRSTTASARAGAHMRTFRPVRNTYRSVPNEKSKSSSGMPVLTQNLHPRGVSAVQKGRKHVTHPVITRKTPTPPIHLSTLT